jgi:hypothetical protein
MSLLDLVFVDSTALIAVLDRTTPDHLVAGGLWRFELDVHSTLVTTDCTVLKTALELQERHGLSGVDQLFRVVVPALRVERCTDADVEVAVATLLAAGDPERDLVAHLEDRVRSRLRVARDLDHR